MTPEQKELVQNSWQKVAPLAAKAAELFYTRLFYLDPSLRPLFKSDIGIQGGKLMRAITLVVEGLDNLEALLPMLRNLGARHVDYGVRAQHYEVVGKALLWTLDQGLDEEFTPELRGAWAQAYAIVAAAMQSGAADAQAA